MPKRTKMCLLGFPQAYWNLLLTSLESNNVEGWWIHLWSKVLWLLWGKQETHWFQFWPYNNTNAWRLQVNYCQPSNSKVTTQKLLFLIRIRCRDDYECVQWSYEAHKRECLLYEDYSFTKSQPGVMSGPKHCEDNKRSTTMRPTTQSLQSISSTTPKSCECGKYYTKNTAKGRIWNGQDDDPIRDPWIVFINAAFVRIIQRLSILITLIMFYYHFSILVAILYFKQFVEELLFQGNISYQLHIALSLHLCIQNGSKNLMTSRF